MRLSSFFLLVFLLHNATSQVPRNLMQDFIKAHVDYSKDPCDDFYSHVCPEGPNRNFLDGWVMSAEDKIYERNKRLYFGDENVNPNQTAEIVNLLLKYLNTENVLKFCETDSNAFEKLTDDIVTAKNESWSKMNCTEKMIVVGKGKTERLVWTRKTMMGAFYYTVVNMELEKADQRIRELFEEMKLAVQEEFMKTPWAKNKNVLDKFLDHLKDFPIWSLLEYRGWILNALDIYQEELERWNRILKVPGADKNTSYAIASTLALQSASELGELFPLVFPDNRRYSFIFFVGLATKVSPFNVGAPDDQKIVHSAMAVSNLLLLLANTDHASDLYGGVGTVLLHEFMHSFVFSDNDDSHLKPFWTNSSDCVKRQMMKTCTTFPVNKCQNSSYTFEEDAADIAAYRIAWKVYQNRIKSEKSFGTPPKSRQLDKKELFFYSFPTFLCYPWAEKDSNGTPDEHSSNHHRVNSLMSQMDEFAEVFQCKPTDRMVRNKAEHCVLYGKDAPEYKMFRGFGDIHY